jgi:Protein of unknown function (DUF692)
MCPYTLDDSPVFRSRVLQLACDSAARSCRIHSLVTKLSGKSACSSLEKSLELFRRVRDCKPVVCHAVGLSIGRAALFDTWYVEQIKRMHDELAFAWHSDHLSFARLPRGGHEMHSAISLPVPHDQEGGARPNLKTRSVFMIRCT